MDKVKCESCGGMGKVPEYPLVEYGHQGFSTKCPACHGSGDRHINMGDVREAWEDGWDSGTRISPFRFRHWLKTRYGVDPLDPRDVR